MYTTDTHNCCRPLYISLQYTTDTESCCIRRNPIASHTLTKSLQSRLTATLLYLTEPITAEYNRQPQCFMPQTTNNALSHWHQLLRYPYDLHLCCIQLTYITAVYHWPTSLLYNSLLHHYCILVTSINAVYIWPPSVLHTTESNQWYATLTSITDVYHWPQS
jgi:hypothetical protein